MIGLNDDVEGTLEGLGLLTLPMEIHADSDILQRERGTFLLWGECEVTILGAPPKDAALGKLDSLGTRDDLTLGHIGAIEHKTDLLATDDTHGDVGLLGIEGRPLLIDGIAGLQTVDDLKKFVFRERNLLEDTQRHFRGEPLVVFLTGGDDQSCHIEGSRTDEILVDSLCEVTAGTMFATGENHR